MGRRKLENVFKLYAFITLIFLLTLLGCGSGGSGNGGNRSNGNEGNESTAGNSGGAGTATVDSVTLSWDASTTNSDGSPLTDLAGYKIHYGMSSNNYTQVVDIGNFTGAAINNLSPGTWCFSVTAYDASGNESGYSSEFCTLIG